MANRLALPRGAAEQACGLAMLRQVGTEIPLPLQLARSSPEHHAAFSGMHDIVL